MRIKSPPLLISVLAAMLVTAISLSGCGNPPSSPSPSPSSKPLPPLSPSSTAVIDPNAPPAAYNLSKLRAIPSPEDGANVYLFYVDVENTGGQSGTFIATYRIDNDAVKNESKKLGLAPGQKKQLELIGPQQEILILGKAYDEGFMDERQHVVFCGDLLVPITLAERPKLRLISSNIDSVSGNLTVVGEVINIGGNITVTGEVKNISGNQTFIESVKNINGNFTLNGQVKNSSGNITAGSNIVIVSGQAKNSIDNFTVSGSIITVSGEVKNVSQEKIEHIIVVTDFGIANGRIVKTAEAPVVYEPVMAGQTTPFRVTIPDNPAIVVYRVIFKDPAGAIIRATTAETQQ